VIVCPYRTPACPWGSSLVLTNLVVPDGDDVDRPRFGPTVGFPRGDGLGLLAIILSPLSQAFSSISRASALAALKIFTRMMLPHYPTLLT